jgi:VCBS repeat-containing protein
MSSHNQEPNDKTKSSETKHRKRWPSLMTVALFSICLSVFGFAGAAQADYMVGINDITVLESDGTATFTITLSKPVAVGDQPIVINYKTADGSANEPGDYTRIDPTDVSFSTGQDTKQIIVTINEDGSVEGDENFKVDIGLTSCTCGSGESVNFFPDTEGWATIKDNDSPPVANDDVADALNEGGTVTSVDGSQSSLLHDDTDPDLPGDSLTVNTIPVSGPTHASAFTLNADGTFSYTHDGTENLSDSFVYEISDSVGNTDTATVTITMSPVNDNVPVANDDTGTVAEGSTLNEAVSGVLSNDTDADLPGDILTVNSVNGAGGNVGNPTATTNGTVTLNADGSYTYVHDDSENFTDSFTYTVSDGVNTSAAATVDITITAVNDNDPEADDESFTVAEGGTATEADLDVGTTLLDGDTDADLPNDTLTVETTPTSGPSYGALVLNADGTAGTVAEGGTLNEPASGVLGNDTDADLPGDTLTVNAVNGSGANVGAATPTANGTVTLNADGSYTYVHDDSENFTDSFTYTVWDGVNTSAAATVSITINAINDAPVATVDSYTTDEDTALNVAAPGVLGNDTDVEGNPLTAIKVSDPANGSVVLNADGSFDYTPNGDFNGTDSFTYKANDGTLDSNVATVTITVNAINDAPVAGFSASPMSGVAPLTVNFLSDTSTDIDNNIVAWSWDFGDGSPLDSAPNPTHTFNEANTYTVTLTVTDEQGGTDSTTLNVIVLAGISIDNISVAEDGGNAIFTLSISAKAANDVTVEFATANGSAVQPGDYTQTSGGLTWVAGSTSDKTISVPIIDDSDIEAIEAFTVVLSNPSANATITGGTGMGTINDNDRYEISINDIAINEGDGTATFTVTLNSSVPADDWVRVEYSTVDGTAKKGAADLDYTETNGILQFNPLEQAKTVSVPVNDDGRVEMPENFFVKLGNDISEDHATNISDSEGECTINDNDKATVKIDDVIVDESASKAQFIVSIDVVADDLVTFDYATSDGSATAGLDYVAESGSDKIDPGKLTSKIEVDITDDGLIELSETFFLTISNLSSNAVFGDDQGQCTIGVDEQALITINDVTVNEGDGTATLTVSLSAKAEDDVTVDFATADDTAVQPSDYTQTSGTLNILSGTGTGTIDVPIINDLDVEVSERFYVNLSSPSANATFGDSQGLGTILSDDAYDISIVDSADVAEGGSASFAVTITPTVVTGDTVTVNFNTVDGTALAGSDYTAASGTLTFNEGESEQNIAVSTINDTDVEIPENFTAELTGFTTLANANIANNSGACTILVDDAYDISIADSADVTEGDSASFAVNITPAVVTGDTVTVDFTTVDGTALAGSDYTATGGTLTFIAGQSTQNILVNTTDDGDVEIPEVFTVELTGGSTLASGNILDSTGACNITSDDPYAISVGDSADVAEGDSASYAVTITPAVVTGDTVTVNFNTVDGTALAGSDYTAASGTLTFNEGESTQNIAVSTINDTDVELPENFTAELTGFTTLASGNISDNSGACTILVDDPYDISIADSADVAEGGSASFTVTVTPAVLAGDTLSVDYTTVDGTALAASDYTAASASLTFIGGESTKNIPVTTTDDGDVEIPENFTVKLSNAVAVPAGAFSDDEGACNIISDDAYTITIGDAGDVPEGATASFKVNIAPAVVPGDTDR